MEIEPRRSIADRSLPTPQKGVFERWGFNAFLAGAAMVMGLAQPLEAKQSPGRQISEQALAVSRVIKSSSLENLPPLELGDMPNGCLPRAVIFLDAIRSVRPELSANLAAAENGHHSVGVISDGKNLYGYDGYNGGFLLSNDLAVLKNPRRLEKTINELTKKQVMVAYEKENRILDIDGPIDRDRSLVCVRNVVGKMSKDRLPMVFGFSTEKGELPCALFFFNKNMYVYSPASGTLGIPIPEEGDLDVVPLLNAIGKIKFGEKEFAIISYNNVPDQNKTNVLVATK